MSLPHALLTSLLERPASGYDLARRFDASLGHFWPASHQQIYRELARMERAGWVAGQDVAGHARKKVWSCRPAGRAELVRWVGQGGQPPVVRDALLIRLRADAVLGPLDLADQVRERLAGHEATLAAYRAIAERDFGGPLDRRGRLQHAILRAGIGLEETSAQWCRTVLAELDEHA